MNFLPIGKTIAACLSKVHLEELIWHQIPRANQLEVISPPTCFRTTCSPLIAPPGSTVIFSPDYVCCCWWAASGAHPWCQGGLSVGLQFERGLWVSWTLHFKHCFVQLSWESVFSRKHRSTEGEVKQGLRLSLGAHHRAFCPALVPLLVTRRPQESIWEEAHSLTSQHTVDRSRLHDHGGKWKGMRKQTDSHTISYSLVLLLSIFTK